MISSLKINNLALITQTECELFDGFNALTGETGAGKSIIIDSLNFVLGGKADRNLIKTGFDFVRVEVVFDLPEINNAVADFFGSIDMEPEATIIINRTFNLNGKNQIKVNGQTVTAQMLKRLTSNIVDIHGQHENQAVLDSKNHISILDSLSTKLEVMKSELSVKLSLLSDFNNQLLKFGGQGEEKVKAIELLRHEINEIQMANLVVGEDDELMQKRAMFQNSEKLSSNLMQANNALVDNGGVVGVVKSALSSISAVSHLSEELASLKDRLANVSYEIIDICDVSNDLVGQFDYSEEKANAVEERLELIKDLQRKYGNSIEAVLNYLQYAMDKLFSYENSDQEILKITKSKQVMLDEIFDICTKITEERKYIAEQLQLSLVEELADLGMIGSKFVVNFENLYNKDNIEQFVSRSGADKLEFLFSANAGMDTKPLTKIISGGELSRFMLAFKCVTNNNESKTLVFDEIDAGIGGRVGLQVGKKINNLAKTNQVVCVTHLAQIACFADYNFKVEKFTEQEITNSTIALLNEQGKVEEISRMLGLNEGSTSGETSANELIEFANNHKLG